MKTREELEQMALDMRRDAFHMMYHSGTKGVHVGGIMSAIELLAVLYGTILSYDAKNPSWDKRDRFIMSKAHGAVAQYAALRQVGYLTAEEVENALYQDTPYYEHPRMNVEKGIEFSGGSLGQGLSLGVGTALALKRKGNNKSRVYVMLGDGECNEGAIWEAAASVIHFSLKQLTIIIDKNCLQYDGTTDHVMNCGDMTARWESMGFDVLEVNGHDVMEIQDAFKKETERPKVIIAHTIKGKGVSFAENKVEWHSGYFSKDLYEQAMEELNICRK